MQRYPRQKALWVLQIVNGIALYLTYSRSSYVAFAVATVCFILLRKKWKAIMLLILVLLLVIIVPKPGGKTLSLMRMDSTVARIGNWQQTGGLIGKAPIIGYGFNTLRFVKESGVTRQGDVISRAGAGIDSSVLFVLATTGIIGLVIYMWLIWSMVSNVRLGKIPKILYEVYILSLVVLGIHSLFSNSLFYPWVMIWLWIFTAGVEDYG